MPKAIASILLLALVAGPPGCKAQSLPRDAYDPVIPQGHKPMPEPYPSLNRWALVPTSRVARGVIPAYEVFPSESDCRLARPKLMADHHGYIALCQSLIEQPIEPAVNPLAYDWYIAGRCSPEEALSNPCVAPLGNRSTLSEHWIGTWVLESTCEDYLQVERSYLAQRWKLEPDQINCREYIFPYLLQR
jgi:hypothetical protein